MQANQQQQQQSHVYLTSDSGGGYYLPISTMTMPMSILPQTLLATSTGPLEPFAGIPAVVTANSPGSGILELPSARLNVAMNHPINYNNNNSSKMALLVPQQQPATNLPNLSALTTTNTVLNVARAQIQAPPAVMMGSVIQSTNNNSNNHNIITTNTANKGTSTQFQPPATSHVLHNHQLKQRLLLNNIPLNASLAIKQVAPSSSKGTPAQVQVRPQQQPAASSRMNRVETLQNTKPYIEAQPQFENHERPCVKIAPAPLKTQPESAKGTQALHPNEKDLLLQQQHLQRLLQKSRGFSTLFRPLGQQQELEKEKLLLQKKQQRVVQKRTPTQQQMHEPQQSATIISPGIPEQFKGASQLIRQPESSASIKANSLNETKNMFAIGNQAPLDGGSLFRTTTLGDALAAAILPPPAVALKTNTQPEASPVVASSTPLVDVKGPTAGRASQMSAATLEIANKTNSEGACNSILLSDDNSDDYEDESDNGDSYGAVTRISNSVILTKAPMPDSRSAASRNLPPEPANVVIMKLPPKTNHKSPRSSEAMPVTSGELIASFSQAQHLNSVMSQMAMTSACASTSVASQSNPPPSGIGLESAKTPARATKQESLLKRKLNAPLSIASSAATSMSKACISNASIPGIFAPLSIASSAASSTILKPAITETELLSPRAKRSKSLNVPQMNAVAAPQNALRQSVPNPQVVESSAELRRNSCVATISDNPQQALEKKPSSFSVKDSLKSKSTTNISDRHNDSIPVTPPKPDATSSCHAMADDVIDLNDDSVGEDLMEDSFANVFETSKSNNSGSDQSTSVGKPHSSDSRRASKKPKDVNISNDEKNVSVPVVDKHDVNDNSKVPQKDCVKNLKEEKLQRSSVLKIATVQSLNAAPTATPAPAAIKSEKTSELQGLAMDGRNIEKPSMPVARPMPPLAKLSQSQTSSTKLQQQQAKPLAPFVKHAEANKMIANLKMLSWKDRIGSARGTSIRFQLNEFNLLQIHERCPPRHRVDDVYEKPIKERESLAPKDKEQADPLLYLCRRCDCHGPAVDFLAPGFCSKECLRRDRSRQKASNAKLMQSSSSSSSVQKSGSLPAFKWALYLSKLPNTVAAPIDLFLNPFPTGPNQFQIGMKLEAIDPENCSLFCVCTVEEIQGYRLRLTFDGYDSMHDFWVNADSMDLFPPGWCMKTNRILQPPRGIPPLKFNWSAYLQKQNAVAAPRYLFTHLNNSALPARHSFEIGMYLEAEDLNDTRNICVASVADVLDDRIRVHFDGWEATYDYWVDISSPYIHPCGWHEGRTQLCVPPEFENLSFSWPDYICQNGGRAAPQELFQPRDPIDFKAGMKLEVVDPRNSQLIRPATVVARKGHRIKLHLDQFPNDFCFWIEDDSPDLHPISWCSATGHDLEPPPGFQQKPSRLPCSTHGCRGLGNAKHQHIGTHSSRDCCPYTAENWKDDKYEKPIRVEVEDIIHTLPEEQKMPILAAISDVKPMLPLPTLSHKAQSKRSAGSLNGSGSSSSKRSRLSSQIPVHPNSFYQKKSHQQQQQLQQSYVSNNIKTERRDSENPSLAMLSSSSFPSLIPIKLDSEKQLTTHSEENCEFNGEIVISNDDGSQSCLKEEIKLLKPSLQIARRFLSDYGPRLEQNYEIWNANNAANVRLDKLRHGSKSPLEWNVTETAEFVQSIVKSEELADTFRREQIDGTALLLLQTDDLEDFFGLKLGPRVKLFAGILKLRTLALSDSEPEEEQVEPTTSGELEAN